MPRVKRGTTRRQRHKKVLKQAKGYYGRKSLVYSNANEQVLKSGNYARRDRRQRKRDFRQLWITRINAACRLNGMNYSTFMNGLNRAGIDINRKVLAEIAVEDPESFKALVAQAKEAL